MRANYTINNFILFDLETNTTGKAAEICQLSATDISGLQFSSYILLTSGIDHYPSSANKLTVKTVNGIRKLCKENQPVEAVAIQNAIAWFTQCLPKTVESHKALSNFQKPYCTVLIGDNAATFDTPILLRNAGENFVKDLETIDVRFADTLPLFKKLVHYKHPSLRQTDGSPCKSNQSSLYSSLFKEEFDAHDTLADVLAVKRILLSPALHLSGKFIVQYSSVVHVKTQGSCWRLPTSGCSKSPHCDNSHRNCEPFQRIALNSQAKSLLSFLHRIISLNWEESI